MKGSENMEGLEKFIQNKDICDMQGCCRNTASNIIRMLKKTYGLREDELPGNKIPLSVYEYHFRKKTPAEWARRKREQKEKDALPD